MYRFSLIGFTENKTGENKMNVKKMIEKKQNRLNRLVHQGSITQQQANEQVRQYAKMVCKILGG